MMYRASSKRIPNSINMFWKEILITREIEMICSSMIDLLFGSIIIMIRNTLYPYWSQQEEDRNTFMDVK